jgi:hypothetical protein
LEIVRFAIIWSDPLLFFISEYGRGSDAAEAAITSGRCRNSWSRKPEMTRFLFGLSMV